MGSHRRSIVLALLLLTVLAATFAVRGTRSAASGRTAASGQGEARGSAYFAQVRKAVIRGVGRDFAEGTGISGPSFESCLKDQMRVALDAPTISDLAAIYRRPGGSAYAAQTLNALALPLATRCGHPYLVPELVQAAHGLRTSHATGASVKKLGVTYGPYLGLRCRNAPRRDCRRVGIDIVFRPTATRVVALIEGQRIVLRTPGQHDGVRYHDWVGTFTGAHFLPRGRFSLNDEPLYVAAEVRVRFADGGQAHALFPHVLVAPGWG
jgi:hypothetical protein